MFVSYKPEMCFEVFRQDDRCVCGASALITSPQGEDMGYCKNCAKKRNDFFNQIVGDIYIGKNNFQYQILCSIEEMRKLLIKERIYFIVDEFFYKNNSNIFCEPYDDLTFLIRAYREKMEILHIILKSLDCKININKLNLVMIKNRDIYQYYKSEIEKMLNSDLETFQKLQAKQCGYVYTKK